MKYALSFLFGTLVAGGAAIVAFGAVLDDRPVQKAVVAEFVARYCHPTNEVNEDFQMGNAAALSRVAFRSGLQPIAWAEYLKCKAGAR